MSTNKRDILWRIYLMYFFIFTLAVAVIGRIIYIQTAEDAHWEKMALEQSIRYQKIASNRGNIFADDYSLLATSIPLFNVYWDSKVVDKELFFKNIDSLAFAYHRVFPEESAASFKDRMTRAYRRGSRYYRIKKGVEYHQMKALRKMPIFKRGKYRGGLIEEKYTRRKRPYKMLAKRTIGNYNTFLNSYNVGLENAYNQYLEGRDGMRLMQKTSGGWKPLNVLDDAVEEPKNGNDIVTTIDINIQDVAENSLYRVLKKNQADWGCAILMEVKTGEIKAIVNLNHDTANDSYYEGFNHAIGTSVTPGSTFKLPSLMVALKDKKCKLDDVIHTGNGIFTYYNSRMTDAHRGGYGDLTVKGVFEHSSNVGVFKIILNGYEQNPQQFIDGIYSFGLQKPLGIEIKGEPLPNIKDTRHKGWSKLSLPWMSIGYELTLTPLQMLTFYNAVANNGTKVKPMFVKEISQTNRVIKKFKPTILQKQIAPPSVIRDAWAMCEGVVQNGTAQILKNSPYPVAGKTGTAQIYKQGYRNNSYIASFVGYFPADKPKYSCMVMVYNPKSGLYYASQVAVPVFKDIADKIYATELDIQRDEPEQGPMAVPASKVGRADEICDIYATLHFPKGTFDARKGQYIYAYGKDSTLAIRQRLINEKGVPNVKNMTARDAVFLLEQAGLRVEFVGKGKVREQSIAPNSRIVKGRVIKLTLKD